MIFNDISAAPQFFGGTVENNLAIQIRIEMLDEVDGEILNESVQAAAKRYPYFCYKFGRNADNTKIVYELNRAPIPVIKGHRLLMLHSESVDYHMQYVTYENNEIYFNINHAFCDGGSLFRYLHTILYLYVTKKYNKSIDKAGVWLPDDRIDEKEFDDPRREIIKNAPKSDNKPAQRPKILFPNGDNGQKTWYTIDFQTDRFVEYAKSVQGSPASLLPAFMAKAMFELYSDANDGMIIGVAMCNTRPVMGWELSPHKIAAPLILPYPENMRDWQISQLACESRKTMKLQARREHLSRYMVGDALLGESLCNDNIESAITRARERLKSLECAISFTTSYIGQLKWGNLENYIKSCASLTNPSGILITLSATGNNMRLAFLQSFSEPKFVNKFVEIMRREGVECSLSEAMPLGLPYFDASQIE